MIKGNHGKNLPRWQKDAYCANERCGKKLVQREDEVNYNFIKRTTCNKSCGAQAKQQRLRKEAATRLELEGTALGMKYSSPGTPGFEELAKLYGGSP